jgi:hypothetical protein
MTKRRVNNRLIRHVQEEVAIAESRLRMAIYQEIEKCEHKSIGECDYRPSDWSTADPPLRVCLDCGLVEPGWSCGHLVLNSLDLIKLYRDEVYGLRTVTLSDEDKTSLLRKEKTLMEIVGAKLGVADEPQAETSREATKVPYHPVVSISPISHG